MGKETRSGCRSHGMPFSKTLSAVAVSSIALVSIVSPAAAAPKDSEQAVTPILLSNSTINWVAGSTGWINLSWTSSDDLQDVQVTVTPESRGITIEYPENAEHDGYTGLMVDADLSANEIDFTSFRATTIDDNNGTKWVSVSVEWTAGGEPHSMDAGRLKLTNKKYRGDDFAILTDASTAVSGVDADPMANWIEVGYMGLSPMNSDFAIEVSAAGVPIYHPQESFTSLHHDHVLNGGESDVARIFIDPTAITPGTKLLDVTISYTDVAGVAKVTTHQVELSIS